MSTARAYLAPFRDDTVAHRWPAFPSPPERALQLAAFCGEYGIDAQGIVDAVIDGQRRGMVQVRGLAEAGVRPQVDWVADGDVDELAARVAWSEDHRHLFG